MPPSYNYGTDVLKITNSLLERANVRLCCVAPNIAYSNAKIVMLANTIRQNKAGLLVECEGRTAEVIDIANVTLEE